MLGLGLGLGLGSRPGSDQHFPTSWTSTPLIPKLLGVTVREVASGVW